MIFVAAVGAAFALGVGWVLQQRAASHAARSELLRLRLLFHLMRKPVWWAGIGAMVVGQSLGALSFELGPVALAEPLLSTYLLFAFLVAGVSARRMALWHEIAGAVLLSAALGLFIAIGNPRSSGHAPPAWPSVLLAAGIIAAVVVVLVSAARRRGLLLEAVLTATGAGILYGLQDACTRGALLVIDGRGVDALLATPWPYVVVGSATVGIVLLQSAFGAASLDYSLPPVAATEPIVGVALGVGLLGDRLAAADWSLAVEALCLIAMVAGVVLIGRSPALARAHHDPVGDRPER